MPEKRSATLGELIRWLDQIEVLRNQAAKTGGRITEAPARGTFSGYYAELQVNYNEQANRVVHALQAIRGYDRLRALCEAEGARISAVLVRQMRGQVCLQRGMALADVDAMDVEDFVREVLKLRGIGVPQRKAKPAGGRKKAGIVCSVSAWSDLAIGIKPDRTYWVLTPAPAIGEVFPVSKAKQIVLGGKRWKALLKALADEPDPLNIPRHVVVRALDLLPPPGSGRPDGRARRKAEESAVRSELSSTERPQSKTLVSTLADLRRKLGKVVEGPTGEGRHCLALAEDHLRPGFLVRYLFDGPSGQMRFGQRPTR